MPLLPTISAEETSVNEFEIIEEKDLPTKTYYMDLDAKRVRRFVDGQKAMKQAIYKILQTERYQYHEIYSDNYGSELKTLIGTMPDYAMPEIERRITEALTWDERITGVEDFTFTRQGKKIFVSFTANTIFGTSAVNDFEITI